MKADQEGFLSKYDHEQIIIVAVRYVDRLRYSKRFDYARDSVAVTDD
jgi:hypothetical protein